MKGALAHDKELQQSNIHLFISLLFNSASELGLNKSKNRSTVLKLGFV
jgi:hypothetical protein